MTPAKYLSEMYEHDDRVATVLIPRDAGSGHGDEPLKVEQRGWPVSAAGSDKVQAWLRHLNARRYGLFVGMNLMRQGVRTRHKADMLVLFFTHGCI